jgi:hypothetical protein
MVDPLLITQGEADAVFLELGKLSVHLDDDPLAFGPKRLNAKVAEVRRMLDRCERVFLDISHRLQASRRALRIIQAEFAISKKDLLANDPVTRAGRSVEDRDAIATGKLLPLVKRMNELEMSVTDLEQVLIVVKAKRSDLKDTEGRLRDQVRLCQQELGLGQHWGSQMPPEEVRVDLRNGHGYNDAGAVRDIISQVDGEVHLARETGTWQDPVSATPVTPGDDPVVAAEPILPPEVPPAAEEPPPQPILFFAEETDSDRASLLPGTVSTTDVDSFLAIMNPGEPGTPNRRKMSEPDPEHVALQEDGLLAFLDTFESPV